MHINFLNVRIYILPKPPTGYQLTVQLGDKYMDTIIRCYTVLHL